MLGKINPVIPEVLNQVCYQVIGFDSAIAFCVEGGQLELNAFEPLICYNILTSIKLLTNALEMFTTECEDGIIVNEEKCYQDVIRSLSLTSVLTPYLG